MATEPVRQDVHRRGALRPIGDAMGKALDGIEQADGAPATDDPRDPEKAERVAHPLRVTATGGLRVVGGDEDPAWKPHAEYDESGCPGTLRFVEREGAVWIVECDHDPCSVSFGMRRANFDRDYRLARLRSRASLPERFVGRALEPHPGNEQALQAIAAIGQRWGERDCPRPPLLVGRPGRGKTHLVTAALLLLIERHEVEAWYLTVADLLDEAKRNMETESPVRPVFDRAATVALLGLDDLGADTLGTWAQNELQALIDRRHRLDLPIIGATNTPVEQWDRKFGERVASRLHDLSCPVSVGGYDWRRKKGGRT